VLALAFTDPPSAGALTVVILLISVFLHELGHTLAALRVGGKVDAVVVGPVGGLVSPRVPDEPEVHLFVAMAGPIVHLTLVVAAAVILAIRGETQVVALLNPVAPLDFVDEPTLIVAAKLTLWLNWILLLLNLLPTYPFDGGPILRAMLWPALGRRTARIAASRAAMALAVFLCLLAPLSLESELVTRVPMWIPLSTLGIFLFFSARQDLAGADAGDRAEQPGYHASADGLDLLDVMWSNEDDDEGVLVEHQQSRQQQSRRAQEAVEDARVDDILARLHDAGFDALSPEEVDVLQRASERYKQRRRSPDDA
jgi:Zn-dependent protease